MKEDVLELLKTSEKILLLPHNCPDPDAMGSALALALGLEQSGKRVSIGLLGSLSEPTKNLLNYVNHNLTENPDYSAVDLIVVLDTNSPLLFDADSVVKSGAKKAIIDHHSPKPDVEGVFNAEYLDESAVSATQLIYELLSDLGVEFRREICLPIVVGIVVDSAFFMSSQPETFGIIYELLLKGNLSFQDILEVVNMPRSVSEKIACLKGAQRLELTRVGESGIIATSSVSAYEGNVAKFLIKLGADVSFVGSVHDGGEARISARATNEIVEFGLHLGRDILPKVSEIIGGDAGGHAGAAGAHGTKPEDMEKALKMCVEETKKFMEEKMFSSPYSP